MLMATNLDRAVTHLDGLLPKLSQHLWIRGLVRSCDELKSLYIHYHGAYGHQTRQDSNSFWWAPAHKVTWPFNHVLFWGHVAT